MTGRIHSIQSLGTVDGPGVRFVAFLQGCPLRCKCCHNPDTWDREGGSEITAAALFEKALRFRSYFGERGGVTLSGGEPLWQAAFATEFFSLCRREGVNTCLDTSGFVWNRQVEALLGVSDRVLLDIKYTEAAAYRAHVGCELSAVLSFLDELQKREIPTTLRQVIIPTLNDSEEAVKALAAIGRAHTCVDGIELLPFRKLCTTKYEALSLPFPLAHVPEPTDGQMEQLRAVLREGI